MRFTVTIACDNAAFEGADESTFDRGREVARILRELAKSVENEQSGEGFCKTMRDENGNSVGRAEFVD